MNSSTRAWTLLGLTSLLLLFLGQLLGGREGLLWMMVMVLSANSLIYFLGGRQILSRFRGRRLEGADPWGLLNITKQVAKQARVPLPRVVVISSHSAQASAVGNSMNNATIILTEGLLDTLSEEELRAVIAYHIASIRLLDTLAYGMASALVAALFFLTGLFDEMVRWMIGAKKKPYSKQSQFFTFLFAPVAAVILRAFVSPSTYLKADKLAASYIDDPKTLARALWKLESYASTLPLPVPASLAHQFIVNPLTGSSWTRYFQVQPKTELRIKNLIGYYPI